jgi:hypothetical protein
VLDDLFNVGSFAAKALRRSILRYTRRPIEYNFERLPKPEQYRDMELAFREDYFDPPPFSFTHFFPFFKYALLLFLILGAYLLFGSTAVFTVAIVIILGMPELLFKSSKLLLQRKHIQLSLAIFFVITASSVFLLGDLLKYAILVTLCFGLPMILLLRLVGADFYDFCSGWLHSHPCLQNDERLQSLKLPRTDANLKLAVALLGVLLLGSQFSPFLAHLAVYAILVLSIATGPLVKAGTSGPEHNSRRLASVAGQLITEYFTYGRRFSDPLPGVWTPKRGFLVRRRYAVLLLLLTLFTFAGGTNYFFAWNMPGFRGYYVAMFNESIYSVPKAWEAMKKGLPEVDWTKALGKEDRDGLADQRTRLSEERKTATTNRQIQIDEELRALRQKSANAGPAIQEYAALWYNFSANSWMDMAIPNILLHPVVVVSSFLLALLNALFMPALFFVAAFQKPLVALARLRGGIEARVAADVTRTPWEWFVSRLRDSRHTAPDPINPDGVIRESDHLFMGLEAENGFPVLLHRDIVAEHTYITGGTGTGKTSLGILSMLTQLIRSGTPGTENLEGGMPPIVVIDLKGDYALMHGVREEVRKQAEREGRTLEDCFRLFTSEKDMPTHYFNPVGDMTYPDRYVADLANLLLDALELNHGSGYGRSFYSRKNYMLLHEALKTDNPADFDELCKRVAKATQRNQEDRHQGFELLATLYGLTEFEQLKPPRDIPESDTISMRQVIEKRQVVYFWLPTVESSILAREIANLALFSYFSAMRARAKTRVPLRQSYLVIDEFQRLAGERFSVILEQARGFGLSTILSNQSMSDLNTPAVDLRSTVLQNTRLKLYFSFADVREMADFAKRSGDELIYKRSGEYALAGDMQPDAPYFDRWTHAIKSKITTNDMLCVTDHPLQAYMDVRSGAGYTQFGGAAIPLQMFHPVRWSDFQKRRDELPWPTLQELGARVAMQSTVAPDDAEDRALAVLARLDARIHQFDEENPHLRFS